MLRLSILGRLIASCPVILTAQAQAQNTTCYFAAGQELSNDFVPCGDPATGYKTCCQATSNCLEGNTCWIPGPNSDYKTTYLAGCTDPSYDDSSCPNKAGYSDNPWAGLIYCNKSIDQYPSTSTGLWSACNDTATTLSSGAPCSLCTSVVYTTTATLQYVMSVDHGTSSCDSSFSASCATDKSSASAASSTAAIISSTESVAPPVTSGSESSDSVVTVTVQVSTATTMHTTQNATKPATAGATPATSTSTILAANTGLNTQAMVGVAVGSVAGASLGAILLWFILRTCRRNYGKKKTSANNDDGAGIIAEKVEAGDPRSPTYTGHRSELPATDLRSPTSSNRFTQKSELGTDEHEVKSFKSPTLTTSSGTYAPYRGSHRSATPSEVEGSPRIGGPGKAVGEGVYEMPG